MPLYPIQKATMHPIARNPQDKYSQRRRVFWGAAGFFVVILLMSVFGNKTPPPAPTPNNSATRANLPDELKNSLALLINTQGELCAQVLQVTLRGHNLYDVSCTRYRDGTGSATYLVDLNTGAVK